MDRLIYPSRRPTFQRYREDVRRGHRNAHPAQFLRQDNGTEMDKGASE